MKLSRLLGKILLPAFLQPVLGIPRSSLYGFVRERVPDAAAVSWPVPPEKSRWESVKQLRKKPAWDWQSPAPAGFRKAF